MSFVTQIGKLPLPCRSAPGFLVNRVLTPYMLEALHAHEDGHRARDDRRRGARASACRWDPIELADRVGLDVALHVAKILERRLVAPAAGAAGARRWRPASSARRPAAVSIATGTAGRSSNGRSHAPDADLADRLDAAAGQRGGGVLSSADRRGRRICSTPAWSSAPASRRSRAGRSTTRGSAASRDVVEKLESAREAIWDALHTARRAGESCSNGVTPLARARYTPMLDSARRYGRAATRSDTSLGR